MANETVDMYSGEVGDQVSKGLSKTMAAVPCGLPVLPPHWVFTTNVWTYEAIGMYNEFKVIDNDNEVIPKPYFGHKGQMYVRKDDSILHNGKYIGDNVPLTFNFTGYSVTVVGPGPKGVGDKAGGSIEKSVGYETLAAQFGE